MSHVTWTCISPKRVQKVFGWHCTKCSLSRLTKFDFDATQLGDFLSDYMTHLKKYQHFCKVIGFILILPHHHAVDEREVNVKSEKRNPNWKFARANFENRGYMKYLFYTKLLMVAKMPTKRTNLLWKDTTAEETRTWKETA